MKQPETATAQLALRIHPTRKRAYEDAAKKTGEHLSAWAFQHLDQAANYTPGPWEVLKGRNRLILCKKTVIAEAIIDGRTGKKRMEANARLMTAAPELFDLVKDLRELVNLEGLPKLSKRVDDVFKKIKDK